MTEIPKLFDLNFIKERVKFWKYTSEIVVFTNGCFDVLHPGHIHLLKTAASFGTKLIVAINSDESVKRLKGEDRPIYSEKDRASILSAIKCVDMILIFEDETPMDLLKSIKPDILVKGGDYTIENVVGAEYVQKYGGEVRIVPSLGKFSTSKMIEKLRK